MSNQVVASNPLHYLSGHIFSWLFHIYSLYLAYYNLIFIFQISLSIQDPAENYQAGSV